MPRAAKLCSHHDCPNIQPCPDHARTPWARSTTTPPRSTLSGWAQQRRAQAILRKDDTCHVCGHEGADQVDHVTPVAEGGADDPSNLRPIHRIPCHRDKTTAEAARARTSGSP